MGPGAQAAGTAAMHMCLLFSSAPCTSQPRIPWHAPLIPPCCVCAGGGGHERPACRDAALHGAAPARAGRRAQHEPGDGAAAGGHRRGARAALLDGTDEHAHPGGQRASAPPSRGTCACSLLCRGTHTRSLLLSPFALTDPPPRAESLQEVYALPAWYADVLQRHAQLVAWTAGDVTPPPSIWLPGLFNREPAAMRCFKGRFVALVRLPTQLSHPLTMAPACPLSPCSQGCSDGSDAAVRPQAPAAPGHDALPGRGHRQGARQRDGAGGGGPVCARPHAGR